MSQSPQSQINGLPTTSTTTPSLTTLLTTVSRDSKPSIIVNQYCFLCLKDAVECDLKRPCARCKSLNVPHMCFGSELYQKTQTQTQHREERYSTKKRKRNLVTESESELSTYQPFLIQNSVDNGIVVNSSNYEQTKDELMKSNLFLLNELKKVKEEQNRMREELHNLRVENEILKERFNKFLLSTFPPSPSLQNNAYIQQMQWNSFLNQINRSESRDTAMVVFDLVKSPAIILTANEQFCRLFGYKMEDVVGMPWKQLIHPDYLERTTAILRQGNLQNKIQFLQVYRTSTGTIFVALDTHTFFFGGSSTPRADLVAIQPLQSNLQNALPSPANRNFWPVGVLSLVAPQSSPSSSSSSSSSLSSSSLPSSTSSTTSSMTTIYPPPHSMTSTPTPTPTPTPQPPAPPPTTTTPSTTFTIPTVPYNYYSYLSSSQPPPISISTSTSTPTPTPTVTTAVSTPQMIFSPTFCSSATSTSFIPMSTTTTSQDVTPNIYIIPSYPYSNLNPRPNSNVTVTNSILLPTTPSSTSSNVRSAPLNIVHRPPGVGVNTLTSYSSPSTTQTANTSQSEETLSLHSLTTTSNTNSLSNPNSNNNNHNNNSNNKLNATENSQLSHNTNQKSPRTQNTSISNSVSLLPVPSSHHVNMPTTSNDNNSNSNNNNNNNQNTQTNTITNVNRVINHGRIENVSVINTSHDVQRTPTNNNNDSNINSNDSQTIQSYSQNSSVIHVPPPSTPPTEMNYLSELLEDDITSSFSVTSHNTTTNKNNSGSLSTLPQSPFFLSDSISKGLDNVNPFDNSISDFPHTPNLSSTTTSQNPPLSILDNSLPPPSISTTQTNVNELDTAPVDELDIISQYLT